MVGDVFMELSFCFFVVLEFRYGVDDAGHFNFCEFFVVTVEHSFGEI